MKRKGQSSRSNACGDQFLIKLSSHVTGRQLYEQEHKDEINAEATKRRKDANSDGGHAGFYQAVLKEMWEDEEDQEAYEKRAEESDNNIPQCVVLNLFCTWNSNCSSLQEPRRLYEGGVGCSKSALPKWQTRTS